MSAQKGKDLLIRAGDGAGGFTAVVTNEPKLAREFLRCSIESRLKLDAAQLVTDLESLR